MIFITWWFYRWWQDEHELRRLTSEKNLEQKCSVLDSGGKEEFYLIKMFGDVDGELLCIRYKTTVEGKTKCAWPDCVSSSARQYCEYIQRRWRECRLPELEQAQTQGEKIADGLDNAAGKR